MQKINALQQLINVEKDSREFGFTWPNQDMVIDQIIDECREVREDIQAKNDPQKIQEEIGDVLHSAISLCIFSGFDVEETFLKTSKKFEARMNALKILTKEINLPNLHGQSTSFMLDLWQKAKIMAK